MLTLLLAVAAASTPVPGTVNSFGDWNVGCDNAGVCTAVSLIPQSPAAGATYIPVVITIGPGPKPDMTVQLAVKSMPAAGATLFIQDEPVIQPTASSGSLYVNDVSVTSVLSPMVLATGPAVLKSASGATIGMISVSGISATLRYIDAQQGRAGTTAAFVATGSATMANRAAPAAPNITQPALAQIGMLAPDAGVVAKLRAQYCGNPVPAGTPGATSMALDNKSSLMLVPCGLETPVAPTTAKNNMMVIAITDNGSGSQLANFDVAPGWGNNPAFPQLINPKFDATTGVLSDVAHSAPGDLCGVAHQYVWDGSGFRLMQQSVLNDCRGGAQRIQVWTAGVNSGQ